ncbi:MAG: serine hydrolase domain-containing protein [Chitinophagales bacterium]
MMVRFFAVIAFLMVLIQTGVAQTSPTSKLDAYLDALESNDKFMGSIAVSKAGVPFFSRSIGYEEIATQRKADSNSIYRIGSISKTFTTVLVMKAVEGRKLDLDQTIHSFFPGITNSDKITLRFLLQHRSGIPNFTEDAAYLTWHTEAKSEQEMVAMIEKLGSDFIPGTTAAYSNSNFVLLTYILEKTYQQSYAELLRDQIIKPLGLTNTFYSGVLDPSKKECKSYRKEGSWKLEAVTDPSVPLGAGSIVASASDVVAFSAALFGGKLVSKQSLEWMQTVQDGYGMGLFPMPFYDQRGWGHTGGIDGFSSVFAYFPEGDVSFAITSNGHDMNMNDLSIAVLSSVYNKPFEVPTFSRLTLRPEELDPYLGIYSSSQIPLKIAITQKEGILIAQATGQSSFPLEATAKDVFQFEQAGIVMVFNPSENKLLLKQGGAQFSFSKE